MAQAVIEEARREIDRLRRILRAGRNPQVRSRDEIDVARATALAWFSNHQPRVAEVLGDGSTTAADAAYKELLTTATRAGSRRKYDDILKEIRAQLIDLEASAVDAGIRSGARPASLEAPPDFSPLVADPQMQLILAQRWKECHICVEAGAPLAAVVMMGGLLEALLLGRIQKEPNKQPITTAAAAPKDKNTGKATPLNTWTLKDYIDVAHELGWISQTARDVGVVLRDYRNYVHPQKELSHGVTLTSSDARVLWEITKSMARHAIRVR